jgi:putative N6-adenine-specific DNA methylase
MTRRRRRPGRSRAAEARFFATAAKGTEQLLADELRELGLPGVAADPGGVHFGAAVEDAWRACLWSRIALRIVEPLATFPCQSGQELYDGVRSVDWAPLFAGGRTLAIRAAGQTPDLNNTQFVALRTKDAIVDQLRERHGTRPDVDREDPDVLVFIHLSRGHASVNIDYSGGSLHARGLRAAGAVAPLRETLAAALVRFSGWRGDTPLCDPMCGSGTLLLEAAGWAGRRAPGLERRFGFERWGSFDDAAAQAMSRLREEARAAARPAPQLFASDTDPAALEQTRSQAARAGFSVQARRLSLREVGPDTAPGALLMNPPYGQRLERSRELERDIGELLERYREQRRALIVPQGFPVWHGTSRWLHVFNGALECEFRRFDPSGRNPHRREPSSREPSAPDPARS